MPFDTSMKPRHPDAYANHFVPADPRLIDHLLYYRTQTHKTARRIVQQQVKFNSRFHHLAFHVNNGNPGVALIDAYCHDIH